MSGSHNEKKGRFLNAGMLAAAEREVARQGAVHRERVIAAREARARLSDADAAPPAMPTWAERGAMVATEAVIVGVAVGFPDTALLGLLAAASGLAVAIQVDAAGFRLTSAELGETGRPSTGTSIARVGVFGLLCAGFGGLSALFSQSGMPTSIRAAGAGLGGVLGLWWIEHAYLVIRHQKALVAARRREAAAAAAVLDAAEIDKVDFDANGVTEIRACAARSGAAVAGIHAQTDDGDASEPDAPDGNDDDGGGELLN